MSEILRGPLSNQHPTQVAHKESDVDISDDSQHHTLGLDPGQAAPGNHKSHSGDTEWLTSLGTNSGTHGWATYGSGWATPAVRKINGIVYFKGLIAGGSPTAVIWNLPVGWRPIENLIFSVVSNNAFARITVSSAGVMDYTAGPAATPFLSLDQISYPVG